MQTRATDADHKTAQCGRSILQCAVARASVAFSSEICMLPHSPGFRAKLYMQLGGQSAFRCLGASVLVGACGEAGSGRGQVRVTKSCGYAESHIADWRESYAVPGKAFARDQMEHFRIGFKQPPQKEAASGAKNSHRLLPTARVMHCTKASRGSEALPFKQTFSSALMQIDGGWQVACDRRSCCRVSVRISFYIGRFKPSIEPIIRSFATMVTVLE